MSFKIQKKILEQAYPRFEENSEFYLNRIDYVMEKLTETFSPKNNIRLFSAPGRTEIGGNHTDHQRGCVLAAAIDMDILAAVAVNDLGVIRIVSEKNGVEKIDIKDLSKKDEEENTSSSLIRGIASKISGKGFNIKGFDAYLISDVLSGSGLSSSAAFEVMIGIIMNCLFCENKLSSIEIAKIGQYAENVYFGKPSGLMDQTASSVGGVVAIDFRDNAKPIVEKINFEFEKTGYALCIIDSGADHADLTYEYASIPEEMASVANFYGRDYLRDVTKEMLLNNIDMVRDIAGDRAILRAIHFIDENIRAQKESEYLKTGDFISFLKIVEESGLSSYMNLQNVFITGGTRHQEIAFTLALCKEFLQLNGVCRVHGGGFAGTVQVFVKREHLQYFKEKIESAIGKGSCHVLSIRIAGGIELLKEE